MILPYLKLKNLRIQLFALREYFLDYMQFFVSSATLRGNLSKNNLQGLIIRRYHAIEVGLTYKPFRPGFGVTLIHELICFLDEYIEQFGMDWCSEIALCVLYKYEDTCRKNDVENSELHLFLENKQYSCDLKKGGVMSLQSLECSNESNTFFRLVNSRYSCREFLKGEEISDEVYESVVRTALKAPSACNRQPCKVYIVKDKSVRKELLSIQNNNSSWREDAEALLLVTASLAYYDGVRERNAPYVDGGLFCMNLLLALHDKSIGACCLNTNLPHRSLKKMVRIVGADESEVVIVMIAIGKPPLERDVAISCRRKINEIMNYV